MKITAQEFNEKYPTGTPVTYQPIKDGEGISTSTRSEAWELGHGAAVVSVKGRSGGVSLEHITVIEEVVP